MESKFILTTSGFWHHVNWICWMFLFLLVDTGYAYYHIGDNEKPTQYSFCHERMLSRGDERQQHLVIYDNFHSLRKNQDRQQLIYPFSNNFVPLDRIPFEFPLRISIRRSSSVDNSLANLVYANLRIKKLLDEYRELRKLTKQKGQNKRSSNAQGLSISEIRENSKDPEAIYGKWKELTRKYNADRNNINPSGSFVSIRNFTPLTRIEDEEKQKSDNKQRVFSKAVSFESKKKKSFFQEDSEDQLRMESLRHRSYLTKRPLEEDEDSLLLGFFRYVFRIFEFLNGNRVEALIVVLVFLCFIGLLTSKHKG